MKTKGYFNKLCLLLLMSSMMAGCAVKDNTLPNPESPTVITVWHAYNAFAKSVFDKLVTEFNETEGMDKGIVIDAYGYGSEDELDEALFNSANNMIGSDPLPDICSVYPDSASRIDALVPLVELDQYFDEDELNKYRKEFLEEGTWGESKVPKLLPVSKSTELLYLNKTGWNQFSSDTGIPESELGTWEGLVHIAEEYYKWSDGKSFLGMNSYNDFAILTAAQLGQEPFVLEDGRMVFKYSEETAKKVWDNYYVPHIKGWYKSNTYNQDGIKSGNLLAYIGSSAGAGYFPDEVVIDENKAEPIECAILPYPTFEGANVYMTQRGAGMGILTSNTLHETAASEFLKWFTDPEQNVVFTGAIGYMPVEEEALSSISELLKSVQGEENRDVVKKSVETAVEAMEEGRFYIKKTFSDSYRAEVLFSEAFDQKIEKDLNELELRVGQGETRDSVVEELLHEDNFNAWYENLIREMAGKRNE